MLQLPEHQKRVPVALVRRLAVVAADCFPRVAILLHAGAQNFRSGLDVAARITQGHPMLHPEVIRPAGINLHHAEIVGAVPVPVDGARVEIRLNLGYCPEDDGIYPVFDSRFVKTELLRMNAGRHKKQRDNYEAGDSGQGRPSSCFRLIIHIIRLYKFIALLFKEKIKGSILGLLFG